jgi:hypothetical protein
MGIVATYTSLLLLGALDSTVLGTETPVQVFARTAQGWKAA